MFLHHSEEFDDNFGHGSEENLKESRVREEQMGTCLFPAFSALMIDFNASDNTLILTIATYHNRIRQHIGHTYLVF